MKASLRALLRGAIDYAGLFPPAELTLDESIRNYARYRSDPQAWMLGRFICPAARLRELEPYLGELFADGPPLPLAALGRVALTQEAFDQAVALDMADLAAFGASAGRRAEIGAYETRVPPAASIALPGASCDVFLEWPLQYGWREFIDLGTKVKSGFKLRTGGVSADAFPPSEQIAFALVSCRDRSVPMKFTAGLHHPIRHFNASVDTKMHGFVNVLVAGVLAKAAHLAEPQLVAILEDEDAASFTFADAALRWKDQQASIEQIQAARRELVLSFGSCSFVEPRDDLRALGWL